MVEKLKVDLILFLSLLGRKTSTLELPERNFFSIEIK
tara:strand:- start:147654 stop:147764 length:111 start_codon:yes stop_codon:yes gene_type:complete